MQSRPPPDQTYITSDCNIGGVRGMLTVETIARVRREQARGKSVRAIARDLRLARDTVTKYLRSGETEAKYERHCQPYPQLGPFLADLEELP